MVTAASSHSKLQELWTHANPSLRVVSLLPVASKGFFSNWHCCLVASAPAGGCCHCHPGLGTVPAAPLWREGICSPVPCRVVIFKYKTISFLRKSFYSSEQERKFQESAPCCFTSLFPSPKMLTLGSPQHHCHSSSKDSYELTAHSFVFPIHTVLRFVFRFSTCLYGRLSICHHTA